MRHQRYCIYLVCAVVTHSVIAPSLAIAQSALDKFGERAFGAQNVEKYAAELSEIGEQLRERESDSQQASQTALTFLNLLRAAKSDQEWLVLASLRPNFNTAWKYAIETGSIAGQQLKATAFGKGLPAIYEQSKKIIAEPQAAAEFALGEALVVGPYGRSAGELFRIWQPDRKITDDDLERLANSSKSGIIEKVEKMENKELLSVSGLLSDCVIGLGAIGGDILTLVNKRAGWKSRVGAILSVPGGFSQVSDCIQKLGG